MSSPYVRRLRLGREIRALRAERNWTQARLARLAGMSRTDVSRLENGQAADLAQVLNILEALEVEGEQWTALGAIAQSAVAPGWWNSVKHIGERQALTADLESGAATIRQYQQTYLPGLLQLPEYVQAVHHATGVLEPVGPVDGFLAGRVGRQRHLRHPGGPDYEVIVDEIAILRRVAPDHAVKAQLRHLAQVARGGQPRVTLRVLRADVQVRDFAAPRTAYTIYSYPDPSDLTVVVIDNATDDVILTDEAKVALYEGFYERIREAALSPEESASLLAKEADMLPGT